jgi:hypothetical protein
VKLLHGVVEELHHSFLLNSDGEFKRDFDGILERPDRRGDGTVPRNSANPVGASPFPVPQQHGPLAKDDYVISIVCLIIADQEADLGPRLGEGDIGLNVPDVVTPDTEWTATVTGVAPHEATCTVVDVRTGIATDHPPLHRRDDKVQATVSLPEPGLFRIVVSGGGTTPVSQLVMAEQPADDAWDDDE